MKLRYKFAVVFITFSLVTSAFGLTASERDTLKQVQAYVRQGQVEYNAAMESAAEADQRAADAYAQANLAQQHAKDTDKAVAVVTKQIDEAHNREVALKKDNDRMKPIVDQVNSKWGLGAFAYGFKVLSRHLLILAGVIIALVIICIALCAAFPLLIPIFSGIFHAIAIVFHIIGYFVEKALSGIASLFRKSPPPTPPPSMPTTQVVPPPAVPAQPGPPTATSPGGTTPA